MFCASEKIAYGRNYIFRSFLEKLSSSFALHPPPTVEVRGGGGGVFAVDSIPAATTYGPFLGKWAVQPEEHKYAWEVSDPDTVAYTGQSKLIQFGRSVRPCEVHSCFDDF